MANVIPPIPYKSQMLNSDGFLSEAWAKWFRQMFNNIVGVVTLPTSVDLANVESSVSTLSGQVTALQSSVTTLNREINDLNQGRQL